MPDTKSKDSPGNVNLETHPLVAKLHADPDELTKLVALVGYLGPSKRAGYVRLYADLSFRNYYEIPTEGILSTTPADAEDENSPTTVHVAGDTQVEKVSITSQSTEARFLQGSISSDYLGTAGVGADAGCSWPPSPTCWCRTANNCAQAGAQANAQPYPPSFGSCYGTCRQPHCGQAGAQANAEPWPASPTCWCNITRNCPQQAPQPYTDTYLNTCACTYHRNNCGQAGAQANAEPQQAPQPYADTYFNSCICTSYRDTCRGAAAQGNAAQWPRSAHCDNTQFRACTLQCGQAGAGDVGCSWPASPTCWCVHTSQGCT